MHPTAMSNGKLFFDTYVSRLGDITVAEIGSQDVNGSLRDVCPENAHYIGLDFQEAKGVDVLLTDPYLLPFDDDSIDVIVSSSCFEHSEMFWLVFKEILRVLKSNGLFYLNVPTNGFFHRYPVDCWRFYPDSGTALVTWGRRCGFRAALLESFVTPQKDSVWNDFIAVFIKDENYALDHPHRMTSKNLSFENGTIYKHSELRNPTPTPEDIRCIDELKQKLYEISLNEEVSREKYSDLQAQSDNLRLENFYLKRKMETLQASMSWKLTAPLRAFKRLIKNK